jgi:hypothetical protein
VALIEKITTEKRSCLTFYLEGILHMETDFEEFVLLHLCVLKFSETFCAPVKLAALVHLSPLLTLNAIGIH